MMNRGLACVAVPVLITAATCFGGAGCVGQQSASGRANPSQSFAESLATTVPEFDSDQESMVGALLRVVYQYHLPLGLECVDREAVHRPIRVKLLNKSVREVLQAVVSQLPEYRVAFGPGVVEVYSPKARENRANLLNTVISNFDVQKDTIRMASANLWGLLVNQLHPGSGFAGDVLDSFLSPRITLHVAAAPVYQILDRLVAEDAGTLWAVAVPPDRLSALQPQLWKLYDLNFANWEDIARRELVGLFPSAPARRPTRPRAQ
jgi:hypothetical protein